MQSYIVCAHGHMQSAVEHGTTEKHNVSKADASTEKGINRNGVSNNTRTSVTGDIFEKCYCELCLARVKTGVGDRVAYLNTIQALDTQILLSNCVTNIKILYAIITTLVFLIVLGIWILQNEIYTIRNECQMATSKRTLGFHNYGVVFNNSETMFLSRHKYNRRRKRETADYILHKTLQKQVS